MEASNKVEAVAAQHGHRKTLDCRNCGAYAPDAFCPQCGQETAEHLPSFREFVHEFVLHYLAAEGKLWRTLRALVSRPGFLTNEYLRGRKLQYVQPLRLYLTCSVVFFLGLKLALALVTTSTVAPAVMHTIGGEHFDFEVGIVVLGAERHRDDSFTCDLPQVLCDRLHAKLYGPRADLEKMLTELPQELFSHFSTAMFLLLPLFALWLRLAYPKRTYGEHFLVALHLHSLWFLVLLLALPPIPDWFEAVLLLYLLGFSFLSLQRVYGGRPWQTAIKGVLVGSAYLACLIVATSVLGIAAIVA
jgi:hypothetical protein